MSPFTPHPRSTFRSLRAALGVLLLTSGPLGGACSLLANDFEPAVVTAPPAPAELPDTSAAPDAALPACSGPVACCVTDGDCEAGEACSSGACVAEGPPRASADRDAGVAPCSGSDCAVVPELLEASCDDGQQNGSEGGLDCGGDCPEPCDTGGSCSRAEQCRSQSCNEGRCAEATCEDQVDNGDETDLDCGGSCERNCAEGGGCRTDEDCSAGLFCPSATGTCTTVSCQDGVLNGAEILADCGGGSCPGCVAGTACGAGSDCASRVCDDGRCTEASCVDGVQNAKEQGADCGGGCPRPCSSIGCDDDGDCSGVRCDDVACAAGLDECCQPPSCADGLSNGTETGVDCGGNAAGCARCPDRASCVQGSDCSSGLCFDQICISCDDDVQNGLETAVDCGGPVQACQRCPPGQGCAVDGDCRTGVCEGGRCCGGTLGDCTRCAERLSPTADCTDAVPAAQGSCIGFLQCLANNPAVCTTRFAPGCSAEGGVCNHNFFGGDGSVGLQQANAVIFDAGCQF